MQLQKQFMVGVVKVRHNPGRSGAAPSDVNVLKAGQCSSCDALSTSAHSMESFPVLGAAVAIPGSDASRDDRLDSGREDSLQPCGDLTFPQTSELIQALPTSPVR